MLTIMSLVACLQANPTVCPTFIAPVEMSFYECLGIGGQHVALEWQKQHPEYRVKKIRCTVTNDPEKALELLEDQPA